MSTSELHTYHNDSAPRPRRSLIAPVALGVLVLGLAGFATWLLTLPPAPPPATASPVAKEETDAMLAALQPRRQRRPVVAVIGINDATETTDYLMTYGILRRADVADVQALATERGLVRLYPALTVQPHATVAEFDARHPEGADYVIVPAMSRDDDPAALRWIREQARKGAIVVSVCAGAKVLAEAGLLDGRRATTHWYYLKELRERHPDVRYVANRRMVVDGGVATTTGITASMPMMLTLIEAIAGRERAEAVAREMGLERWDARHDSDAFRFNRPFASTVLANRLAFWNREELGLNLTPGVDEVTLALVADAWSRTYRSRALTLAATPGIVRSRGGIGIHPDRVAERWPAETLLRLTGTEPPAHALDRTLADIATRLGPRTAYVVALQLEYPGARAYATRDGAPARAGSPPRSRAALRLSRHTPTARHRLRGAASP